MFILKCQCPSIFPRPSHCTEDFSEVALNPHYIEDFLEGISGPPGELKLTQYPESFCLGFRV
jgi:hypothetical protein